MELLDQVSEELYEHRVAILIPKTRKHIATIMEFLGNIKRLVLYGQNVKVVICPLVFPENIKYIGHLCVLNVVIQ